MWRTPLEQSRTAVLYLGLILSHLDGGGSTGKLSCLPGQRATLPCSYHYEDQMHISQLSVQWRSPLSELLCHYIKHKAFQNCTPGYTISYSPGNITLTIQQVRLEDFGTHVCSVSKRHEFSDYSIELARISGHLRPTFEASASGGQTVIILLTVVPFFLTKHRHLTDNLSLGFTSFYNSNNTTNTQRRPTEPSESVTSAPTGGMNRSGFTWRLFVLHALASLLFCT